jgi:hypothetical protein
MPGAEDTYNPPRVKRQHTSTFFGFGICSFQIPGRGRARMPKYVMMLKAVLTIKNTRVFMQVPSASVSQTL